MGKSKAVRKKVSKVKTALKKGSKPSGDAMVVENSDQAPVLGGREFSCVRSFV